MAFSSFPYMRKRLPQPKARIETFALVRPSVRVGSETIAGWASATSGKSERPTPAVVRPTRSRNFLRDKSFLMGTPWHERMIVSLNPGRGEDRREPGAVAKNSSDRRLCRERGRRLETGYSSS